MGILVAAPRFDVVSELWLRRMTAALEPHVVMLAASETGNTSPQRTPCRARGSYRTHIPIVHLADGPVPLWRRCARRAGLPVAWKPARRARDVLANAVASPSVDAVLVHFADFALRYAQTWAECGKPVFVHCHGYDTTWDKRSHERPEKPKFPPGYADAVRRMSDHVTFIANSQVTRRRLMAVGVPDSRVVVKPLGVPAPDRCPPRPPRTRGLVFLYVGRLIDCKGPDLTLQAFERACDRGLDGRLILAGDGPLRAACELLRRRSPYAARIELRGAVDAEGVARLRAAADVFTAHNCLGPLTRQEEAYGVALVEAMADGLPVVTGRSGGVCETVVEIDAAICDAAEATGVLFQPGDVDAHAEALLRLAHDAGLRLRLGRQAWRRARMLYSIEQERAALLEILGIRGRAGIPKSSPARSAGTTSRLSDASGDSSDASRACRSEVP